MVSSFFAIVSPANWIGKQMIGLNFLGGLSSHTASTRLPSIASSWISEEERLPIKCCAAFIVPIARLAVGGERCQHWTPDSEREQVPVDAHAIAGAEVAGQPVGERWRGRQTVLHQRPVAVQLLLGLLVVPTVRPEQRLARRHHRHARRPVEAAHERSTLIRRGYVLTLMAIVRRNDVRADRAAVARQTLHQSPQFRQYFRRILHFREVSAAGIEQCGVKWLSRGRTLFVVWKRNFFIFEWHTNHREVLVISSGINENVKTNGPRRFHRWRMLKLSGQESLFKLHTCGKSGTQRPLGVARTLVGCKDSNCCRLNYAANVYAALFFNIMETHLL